MPILTRTYTPIKGRVIRVVALDECGVPLCGPEDSAAIVMSGFTQVGQSAQYNTGDEHIMRTADDDLCVNEKANDALLRLNLTMDFCVAHPGLIANTVSPSRLLMTGDEATGFAAAEGVANQRFSVEVWQRVTGAGACDPTGAAQYVYNAWPNVGNGKIGDYNIASAPSTIQITGETKRLHELWWLGEDWLGPDAVSPIPDHWLQNLTTTPPPTPPATPEISRLDCPES